MPAPRLTHCPRPIALSSLLWLACPLALAQTLPDKALDQREQQLQQQRALQQQAPAAPDVRLESATQPDMPRYPHGEQPCFVMGELRLAGEGAEDFQWALGAADRDGQGKPDELVGHCTGTQGINLAASRVQNAIMARGFITTRILVQPQNLATGVLTLTVVPGHIHAIRYAQPADPRLHAANALPMQEGDLLNLRDIE